MQALRSRGVDARLVVFERYRLHPEADVSLDRHGSFARRQLQQWRGLARLLPRTDVFHFYFGLTLVPQSLQYPLLGALRKKSVMHYLGSDIRGKTPEQLAPGRKAGAQVVGSYVEEPWGSSALAAAEEVARHGTDPELRALALRAVERVAESSELRELGDDDARIEDALSRLR